MNSQITILWIWNHYIILPQTFKIIAPQIGNTFVANIKDTSVLNVIGVAERIQPLASYAYGAHDFHAIRKIRNKAVITAIGVSFFLFIFTIATARFYPAIYGYEGGAAKTLAGK